MRKASPTLCTARLCYAIVSKVHWPPSTANHKTREREREEGSLAANKTLPPSPRKVAARRRFANLCTYIIQHFKTKGKNRGKKMCSVDVTWRQRMLEARFHVLPPFRHLVCVSHDTVGYEQSLDSVFRLAHSNKLDAHTHSRVEGIFRHCTEYRFNLNISVAHWQFSVGTQRLRALVINNLVFFFGKPRCSGHRTLDGF